jgi:hypothetical protein
VDGVAVEHMDTLELDKGNSQCHHSTPRHHPVYQEAGLSKPSFKVREETLEDMSEAYLRLNGTPYAKLRTEYIN